VATPEGDEQAVVRELQEETGLRGVVVRLLFRQQISTGQCACFLVDVADPDSSTLGHDPELSASEQWLVDVRWFPILDKAGDFQVAEVLRAVTHMRSDEVSGPSAP
jgi:8-oxo-dGTP pyrophosphatase MutT (NUDIX family)